MEAICEPVNLRQALKRVKANKGAAGADGMSVSELPEYLKHHWSKLKAQPLSGNNRPAPVRRVSIVNATALGRFGDADDFLD